MPAKNYSNWPLTAKYFGLAINLVSDKILSMAYMLLLSDWKYKNKSNIPNYLKPCKAKCLRLAKNNFIYNSKLLYTIQACLAQ